MFKLVESGWSHPRSIQGWLSAHVPWNPDHWPVLTLSMWRVTPALPAGDSPARQRATTCVTATRKNTISQQKVKTSSELNGLFSELIFRIKCSLARFCEVTEHNEGCDRSTTPSCAKSIQHYKTCFSNFHSVRHWSFQIYSLLYQRVEVIR